MGSTTSPPPKAGAALAGDELRLVGVEMEHFADSVEILA